MKKLVLIAGLLMNLTAFASGTNVGNGMVGCREGAKDTLFEHSNETGGMFVTYTCLNGRWQNLMAADRDEPKPQTCREGQQEYFPDQDPNRNENTTNILYVCRKGKFVPAHRRR